MPTPRGSTMRSTERSRNADANLRSRQRRLAKDPKAIPCPVCGQLLKGMGQGSHRRQHILNGDIDVELPFECADCGERYETQGAFADHRRRGHSTKKRSASNTPERRSRFDYVQSIAPLPYEEFIRRLLA